MVNKTLQTRESTYGSFSSLSKIANSIKTNIRDQQGWNKLEPHHKEALDMIAHKIARIINGDPNHVDSWHDIAGYATLVEDIIKEKK